MIDLEAIGNAEVAREPFSFFTVDRVLSDEDLKAVRADFPKIDKPGLFPLSALEYGPAFARLIGDIQSPGLAEAVGRKFGVNLHGLPLMMTVRGRAQAKDGRIHTDTKDKVVTCLLYLNETWGDGGGRCGCCAGPMTARIMPPRYPPMAALSPPSGLPIIPGTDTSRLSANGATSCSTGYSQTRRCHGSLGGTTSPPGLRSFSRSLAGASEQRAIDMMQTVPSASDDSASISVADGFLACLAGARQEKQPFDHWLLTGALPGSDVEAVAALPLPPPSAPLFNGRRETNNTQRIFFTPENQAEYTVCQRIAAGFKDPRVRAAIAETTRADLSDGHLRIEYCQDGPGFWLEPHTDILVKKFTMLVYLSDNPELKAAGTDIHEGPPDFKYVGTAPYGKNLGVIFIPASNTWHGVGRRPIKALRKSIIINYVTSAWRDQRELA